MKTIRKPIIGLGRSVISSNRTPRALFSGQAPMHRLAAAILLAAALLLHFFSMMPTVGAAASANLLLPPEIGKYPNMTVALGGDITVAPDALPTGTASISLLTPASFNGTITVDS